MAGKLLPKIFLLSCVIAVTNTIDNTFPSAVPDITSPTCPRNSATNKETPTKENNLHECKLYSCNSCCGEAVTTELAHVPLGRVGAVNFSQCGPLSDACSEETSYMECFYQCSPNLFPWMNPLTRKIRKLPICASFCDAWFGKCMSDQTCVASPGNWLSLQQTKDENNKTLLKCRDGVMCRNYSTVYKTGENMCNTIWGDLFVYTKDEENCLHPYSPKEDAAIIKRMFPSYTVEDCYPAEVTYTDPGMIVGIVFGVLAGVCIILAGVAYYLNRKKSKEFSPDIEKKPKHVEVAPPEEMTTLKSSQPLPDKHSDSDSSDHE